MKRPFFRVFEGERGIFYFYEIRVVIECLRFAPMRAVLGVV
jgi:hypothetical protein